jgi:hypothetical protein
MGTEAIFYPPTEIVFYSGLESVPRGHIYCHPGPHPLMAVLQPSVKVQFHVGAAIRTSSTPGEDEGQNADGQTSILGGKTKSTQWQKERVCLASKMSAHA